MKLLINVDLEMSAKSSHVATITEKAAHTSRPTPGEKREMLIFVDLPSPASRLHSHRLRAKPAAGVAARRSLCYAARFMKILLWFLAIVGWGATGVAAAEPVFPLRGYYLTFMRMPAMGSQIATCLRQLERTIETA